MDELPVDHFTRTDAYTPHVYNDVYPSIDPTSPALSQAGKIIIITGASAGIGARGFVPSFAKAKAKAIILVGRNEAGLLAAENQIKLLSPETETLVHVTDVTNIESVASLFEAVKTRFGHADVLISNAGRAGPTLSVADSDPATWWLDFEVNLKGSFLVIQGFLKLLGKERKGTVVNIVSSVAFWTSPKASSYALSKLAGVRLMTFVANENQNNVTAIALHPGIVDTDAVRGPFKKFAVDTPGLPGGTAVWLCTDAARFLNGRMIHTNWSVDDLMARKDEIEKGDDLTVVFQGKFGLEKL